MINRLLDAVLRTSRGDGPVDREWAEQYARLAWKAGPDEAVVCRLDSMLGGLSGRRVLDLGGGPGVQSVALARRGARVVWHDVSRVYAGIAERKAREAGVNLDISLGYMEDAAAFGPQSFDLVFNRVCWNYCRSDRAFAGMLVDLLRPGGIGWVDTHNARRNLADGGQPWYYGLYRRLDVKVGHPFPAPGRVESLLRQAGGTIVETDYSEPHSDRVLFAAGWNA